MVQKIFRKDVAGISADKFREATIMVDGKLKKVRQAELKHMVEKMTEGGKTLTDIEKKLIKAGMEGMQWEKRKVIIKTLGGGEKSLREQAKAEKKAEERRGALVQQARTAAELAEARENPVKKVLTTADGEKVGYGELGIGNKHKDAQISALRSGKGQGPRASIGQPGPTAAPVAGGFGVKKAPTSEPPSGGLTRGGAKGGAGMPPIGFGRGR